MTLAAGERRALAKIEKNLRDSDPKLVARLCTFNRLTQAEEMPQRESLTAPSGLRRLSAGAGFRPGRKRRTPPGQPASSRPGRPASGPDYRSGRDARLGRGSGPRTTSDPASTPGPGTPSDPGSTPGPGTPSDPGSTSSPSRHFSTNRLPSQGHYPHTMRLSNPGRRRGRSRVAAILSVAMAACALGLMVILFSVLNHVRPAGATPAPATTCRYVMMTGCQSAQIIAHKR
jgi:hypothetical protein